MTPQPGPPPVAESRVALLAAGPGIDDLDVDVPVLDGSGGPHAVLARHLAEDPATLLATATSGRTGTARTLHGSETARIIRHSPVPVLAVPPAANGRR